MKKYTVKTGSNIAFIKYWGVSDASINIPLNNSISMTLADAYTTTTVEWHDSPEWTADQIELDGQVPSEKSRARLVRHLDRIRAIAGVDARAHVVSQNNFPMAAGIASSASGFSALSVAGCRSLGLELSTEQLSRLARLESGSASRSLFGGFVEWERGHDDESSVAHQMATAKHWELYDVVVVLETGEKRVSSAGGHKIAHTSPLLQGRLDTLDHALAEVRAAIDEKNLERLGPIIEQDAIAMHAVMMTSAPSLMYWSGATIELMKTTQLWREDGIPVYFTIDAGPNLHLMCEQPALEPVTSQLADLPYVKNVIVSGAGPEPQALDTHLF